MKILIIDDEFYIVEDIRLNTDWENWVSANNTQHTAYRKPKM